MTTRKRRIADSEAIREAATKKRLAQPIVLDRLGKGSYEVLPVRDLDGLQIDERYQRCRVTDWVNTLTHVLLSGGNIPAPGVLSQRPDGSRWIVDGQQRYWASIEAKKPMPFIVYKLGPDFLEIEQKLFAVLNDHRAVKSDFQVRAWTGEIGEIVRKFEEVEDSPLHRKINLGNTTGRPVYASTLVKCAVWCLNGHGSGNIQNWMSTADALLKRPGAKVKVEALFTLLANVLVIGSSGRMYHHVARGFALAAHDLWSEKVESPGARSLNALRRTNWERMVPSAESKYVPVLVSEIKKRWRA